jgi:hypothetical protein
MSATDLGLHEQAALEIVAKRQRELGTGITRLLLVKTLYARFDITRAQAGEVVATLLRATLLREYAAEKGSLLGVEPRDVTPRRHAPVRRADVSEPSEELEYPAPGFESEAG